MNNNLFKYSTLQKSYNKTSFIIVKNNNDFVFKLLINEINYNELLHDNVKNLVEHSFLITKYINELKRNLLKFISLDFIGPKLEFSDILLSSSLNIKLKKINQNKFLANIEFTKTNNYNNNYKSNVQLVFPKNEIVRFYNRLNES